jgi:hypothetical protein
MRSKGLGRKEMVMDFREYEVRYEEDELVIVGVIRDPVAWDFSIRFCEDDYGAILGLMLRKASLWAILRSLFRFPKKHHWGRSREEHIADGKNARALIAPEVEMRVKTAMSPIDVPRRKRRRRASADVPQTDVTKIESDTAQVA